MLSINIIERFFQGRRLEKLLDNLVSNGLEVPLPLRIRLSDSAPAAVALGLRRLVELSYGPTPLSREMTGYLLAAQDVDGSFDQDPLATATAAAAFGKLLSERTHQADAAPVSLARDRALAALAAMQDQDGLFRAKADRTDQDRALSAAFVLSLLARDEEFGTAVRSAELFDWFEQRQEALEPQTRRLWAMARIGAPVGRGPTPASTAMAA